MDPDPDLGENDPPSITKYERARAIGQRARMLSANASTSVNTQGVDDPLEVATREMDAGVCPLVARRFYPDHTPDRPHFRDVIISQARVQ